MAYKEIPKEHVNKEIFDQILHAIGWSYRRIEREYSSCSAEEAATQTTKSADAINGDTKRSERAIRDAVKRGLIRKDVLEELCKFIDIEPDYITGKLHGEIMNSSMPAEAKVTMLSTLRPEKYRYGTLHMKEITFRYLEDLLSLHRVAPSQYDALDANTQLDFAEELENAIVPVIAKYFPVGADGTSTLPEAWWMSAQIERTREELDMPDSLEGKDFTRTRNDRGDPFSKKYENLGNAHA